MVKPDPKPSRQTDEEYLDEIRGRRCLVPRCSNRSDPHHLDSKGSGGSDYTAVELCRLHHTEIHKIGRHAFEEKYGLNLWEEAHRNFRRYVANSPIMK